jgi:hypothetical protein
VGSHAGQIASAGGRWGLVVTGDFITLFRPVGQKELDLIAKSGFKRFPPRLPDQPIFYPVLNREYAAQIARDGNTKDERSGFVGYVLEFDVDGNYLGRFETKKVGGKQHVEYWIPAEELEELNDHIRGLIRIVAKFGAPASNVR